MSDLVERARRLAHSAHSIAGQTRKYTGEPYIVHPAAVVEIVRTVKHTDEMLAAAWLHDVVEDCDVTYHDILTGFGVEVVYYVWGLTEKSKPSDGNRTARKAIDRVHLARMPAEVQTIKVADLIDNTKSIVARDPDFARVYIPEKEALLDVLTRADPALIKIAKQQLEECRGIIH